MLHGADVVEEIGAHDRGERHGDDQREDDREGDRDRELAVDLARDAAHEADRHEDGQEDQRSRDHRARDVLHGLDGGRLGVAVVAVHNILHAFDDDDGVVDDRAYDEHQSEQREDVDAVAESREAHESGQNGNRYGRGRYQRGPQVLQEQVADQHDQREGDEQRHHDLADSGADIVRGVVADHELGIGRQVGRQLVNDLSGTGHDLQSVGAGSLLEQHHSGRLAVEAGVVSVGLAAELYFGHVLKLHEAALGRGPQNDVLKVPDARKASLRSERIDQRLVGVDRRFADGTDGGLLVLALDGGSHVGDTQSHRGDALRIEPDADAVLGSEHLAVAHARHTLHDVLDVVVGVVVEEEPVSGAVRRNERHKTKRA